jgi:hypothetical protein
VSDLRSSGGARLALGGERVDVFGGVPGLSGGASGACELASVDEVAEGAEADAEQACGLVGGEVAGPDVLRLHGPMVLYSSSRSGASHRSYGSTEGAPAVRAHQPRGALPGVINKTVGLDRWPRRKGTTRSVLRHVRP